jgi:hypothetical protein
MTEAKEKTPGSFRNREFFYWNLLIQCAIGATMPGTVSSIRMAGIFM